MLDVNKSGRGVGMKTGLRMEVRYGCRTEKKYVRLQCFIEVHSALDCTRSQVTGACDERMNLCRSGIRCVIVQKCNDLTCEQDHYHLITNNLTCHCLLRGKVLRLEAAENNGKPTDEAVEGRAADEQLCARGSWLVVPRHFLTEKTSRIDVQAGPLRLNSRGVKGQL
ncbi:hypothetical protein O3P69_007121 [Scylla paramamosain]|uniref:Uncharacterized protein n=1 Tax=Scylla paramamosain TaxID=85552 RepID=A0AAW0V1E8_SCYPA